MKIQFNCRQSVKRLTHLLFNVIYSYNKFYFSVLRCITFNQNINDCYVCDTACNWVYEISVGRKIKGYFLCQKCLIKVTPIQLMKTIHRQCLAQLKWIVKFATTLVVHIKLKIII